MASLESRKRFIASVIPDDLLDEVIGWIAENMEPENVFDKSRLDDWAMDNDYIKNGDDDV